MNSTSLNYYHTNVVIPNMILSNKDFFSTLGQMNAMSNGLYDNTGEIIEQNEDMTIRRIKDTKNGITYILLSGVLDNGYLLYVRIPITSIQESVKISNKT